jgi:hypothetical protein
MKIIVRYVKVPSRGHALDSDHVDGCREGDKRGRCDRIGCCAAINERSVAELSDVVVAEAPDAIVQKHGADLPVGGDLDGRDRVGEGDKRVHRQQLVRGTETTVRRVQACLTARVHTPTLYRSIRQQNCIQGIENKLLLFFFFLFTIFSILHERNSPTETWMILAAATAGLKPTGAVVNISVGASPI